MSQRCLGCMEQYEDKYKVCPHCIATDHLGLAITHIGDGDFQPPTLIRVSDDNLSLSGVLSRIRQEVHHKLVHEIGVECSLTMRRETGLDTDCDLWLGEVHRGGSEAGEVPKRAGYRQNLRQL